MMGRVDLARPGTFALALLFVLSVPRHEAAAFSCAIEYPIQIVSPDRVDDAPLNAKIRLEVPIDERALYSKVVLRAHAGPGVAGRAIAVEPHMVPYGKGLGLLELTPRAPLAPSTRYEVALVDRAGFPPQTVLATFRTGAAVDTTAPRFERLGAAHAYENTEFGPGPRGRWVEFEGVGALDPSRPRAQLVFALWTGDAAGRFDTTKPPLALLRPREDGSLFVGAYACDLRESPLPNAPSAWLGLAALDEAGNASQLQSVRIDLASAEPRPPR
jgi:hypothetical protein